MAKKKKIKSTNKQLALCIDIGIPNKDQILNYCIDRGVKNPRFYLHVSGTLLYGDGIGEKINEPLIWTVSKEMSIFNKEWPQDGFDCCWVIPRNFKHPFDIKKFKKNNGTKGYCHFCGSSFLDIGYGTTYKNSDDFKNKTNPIEYCNIKCQLCYAQGPRSENEKEAWKLWKKFSNPKNKS